MNHPTTNNKTSPFSQLKQQYELLQLEYEYEKKNFFERAERASILKRKQLGICWYPVCTGKSYYNSLNQFVIDLERMSDTEMEHGFEYGKSVCFFTTQEDGSYHYLNFSGQISYVHDNQMVVILSNPSVALEMKNALILGVQMYFDETTYKTMLNALTSVMQTKNDRLAELRDIILGNGPVTFRSIFPIRLPWLNLSQEAAVNKVLTSKDVFIVHGPPGTGKTTTFVEAIYETLRRENQVMVCAQSNTAVDWIAEKLVDRGIPVLRIGNPTRVNDKMLSFTYERRFEAHPDYPELWSIRKAIRKTQSLIRENVCGKQKSLQNGLSRLRFRATELEVKIDSSLFDEARVIACTLVGSANRLLVNHRFTTLFIDEAAQALEAACWIAIKKADRVILAGDHHQLPPTIKCIEAARRGLSRTLMEKIAKNKPNAISLLSIQYRMNEVIMQFPSYIFYRNELKAAPEVKHRGILELDTPIVWYDTADCNLTEDTLQNNMSRINRTEAILLIKELQAYIEKITQKRVLEERIDFGIISPYKAQVHYLRSLIMENDFFETIRSLITVHTVDGFQGQERDVIVISLVRANENGQIGFLNDLRRMNVAITRARMKLIILGDASTLGQHKFYHKLYEYTLKYGKVIALNPSHL